MAHHCIVIVAAALWSAQAPPPRSRLCKIQENGKKKQVYVWIVNIVSAPLQLMFDLLKGFPRQWSTKSSVNSILFKELNPPRKCRANVHCNDLELKWSAAIANIHCTTHLFPLTISRDTLSTLSTPLHYLLYLLHKAVLHWASLSALFLHQVDIANLLRSSLKIKVTPEHLRCKL